MANERERKLTKKQLDFVVAYLNEPNATKAAQAAGFSPNNKKAAAVSGYRMLKNANIRYEIEQQQAMILNDLRAYFISDAQQARNTLFMIMNNDEAPFKDRRQAASEILDRAMGKPLATSNIKLDAEIESINVNVQTDLSEYEELFNELSEGVPYDPDDDSEEETE